MRKPGRKRKFPEGTRNKLSFVVDDETLNRFMEAKSILQNSMPEALKTVEITKVDVLRGLDFKIYKPKIITIEIHTKKTKDIFKSHIWPKTGQNHSDCET